MTINKPAIDYANERITELKLVHEVSEMQEAELFDLLIEAHGDAKARVKLNSYIEKLEIKEGVR